MTKPRAKTAEEVREEFLQQVRAYAHYWATLPDQTPQDRCDGMAFSILNILDGNTMLPAFNLTVAPHPEDKEYHIAQGDNWYEPDMLINDCMLHEFYYKP